MLKTIRDEDLFDLPSDRPAIYRRREAARAVLFDDDGKIGLLFVSKENYHKLPGGGIESGEDKLAALKREVLEELGCAIKVHAEVGRICEYRNEHDLFQESYCYTGFVEGKKGNPAFTKTEIASGFITIWLSPPEAIIKL